MAAVARTATRAVALLLTLLLVGVLWWLDSDPNPTPGAGDGVGVSSTVTGEVTQTGPEADPDSTESAPERDEAGLRYVHVRDLPPEADEMLTLIEAGGPYEHAGKDGSTFGNYEGRLPQQRRGYYREYTVDTPGLSHRGARRIVTGAGGEFYWTADHYESFERIRR